MKLNSLGLAYRARKVVVGTDIVVTHLQQNKLVLIVLATDAADNTKKKIYDKAKTYHVDVIEEVSSDQLSQALGKFDIKVIGVTDKGFAQLLSK
jgi:ribosomal protein L7Ae-like RNA K-turn-binding protein